MCTERFPNWVRSRRAECLLARRAKPKMAGVETPEQKVIRRRIMTAALPAAAGIALVVLYVLSDRSAWQFLVLAGISFWVGGIVLRRHDQ